MLITELIITENCNLACKYCYMDNNKKFMDFDTVDLFLENIGNVLKLYKQDSYHISFFGGEPLLNWKLIQYATPKFKEDPRCKSIDIISNGLLLTQDKVDYIKKNNLGFSMSFDGIWQKDNRPLVGGSSSFEEYIKNKGLIKQLVNSSKCMVSPPNIDTLLDNHLFMTQEYGFSVPDFSLVRDNIWSEEDVCKFDVSVVKLADHCIERLKSGFSEFNSLFSLYTLDMLVGKTFGKRSFGCFAGVNGVAFGSSGIFYPCARFASAEEYQILNPHKGVWYKGNIDFMKHPKVSNPKEYSECQSCEIYEYCNAGCTYSELKFGENKRSIPISNVCNLFKICYRESMRIAEELKDVPLYKNILENMLRNSG